MADSTPSNDTPLLSESSFFQPTVTLTLLNTLLIASLFTSFFFTSSDFVLFSLAIAKVSLYDWWLIKSENDFQGKRLAVAGISSRKTEAIRVFVSAPIIKRHDVFSLETSDGVHVIINGFINEQRTLENGFAPEVFNSFLFGFPPNWESYALGCFGEESKVGNDPGNAVTDNDKVMPSSDDESTICPEILSEDVENSIPASLVLPEEGPGNCEKPPPEDECDVSKEMSGVNVAYGSGGNRRSARLHNIKVCQQKQQPATGSPPKHPDKDQSSTSAAMENCDGGPESPSTPIQTQPNGLPNKLSEQLVKKSASRISRTSSAKTEGCYKKKKMAVKTETATPKRKMSKPASSVKSPQERDVNHLKKGSKQKISLVSPESLNLKKSRSGRLLLPPLEFWRNQIPIYNADHEVTEIQEGASLASSCRGSPASLGRFSNQKDRKAQHDARQ